MAGQVAPVFFVFYVELRLLKVINELPARADLPSVSSLRSVVIRAVISIKHS